ncbi:MAG: hypothetical protein ACYSUS_03965 [Planctomycetota bacterium]
MAAMGDGSIRPLRGRWCWELLTTGFGRPADSLHPRLPLFKPSGL